MRDKIWSIALFTLSLAYLAFELAFNSRIVDGASGAFDATQLKALELQGRILSGIGLSLLVAKKVSPEKLIPFIKNLIILCTVCFCFMFFGQKILVEYMVNNSTPEERSDAQYIALLKKGITSNSVQLEDISIPEDQLDTPATKAMTSIMGAMIFNSDTFIEKLKASTDSIVSKAAKNDAEKTWKESYSAYQNYQKEVLSSWETYKNGADKFDNAQLDVYKKSVAKADEIYIEAGSQFKDATKGQDDSALIIRKSLEIKRAVKDYFEAKQYADTRCRKYKATEQKCHIKIENAYRDIVVKEAGRYIPPDYWCYPPTEKTVEKMVRGRVRVLTKEVVDCKTMNRKWFEKKLLAASGEQETISDNTQVANAIMDELLKEGIVMPSTWTMKDKDLLIDKLIAHGKKQVDAEYKKKIIESVGEYLPPTLSQTDFLNHSLVQKPIKDKLEWQSNKNISLNLDADMFFKQLHYPRYEKSFMDTKEKLMIDVNLFADGQAKEEDGKDYYRSIIVPPMAMSFSLFFGLLNLFSVFGICCTFFIKNKIVAKSVSIGSLTLIFFVYPLALPSKTVESDAFIYFQSQLEKDYPKLLSYGAAWVVDAQPIMYPIGHALSQVIFQEDVEAYLREIESSEHNSIESEAYTDTEQKTYSEQQTEIPGDLLDNNKFETIKITGPRGKEVGSVAKRTLADVTYQNQSTGTQPNWPYSFTLLDATQASDNGVYFDVSPIGRPVHEDWVIFNKSRFLGQVCVAGKTRIDSLYHMNDAAWRNATHGNCQTKDKVKLPNVGAYLRKINRTFSLDTPVLVSFNETLISEVRCNRYQNIIDKVSKTLKTSHLTVSTSSISILGCFHNLDSNINTAFKLPRYSKHGKTLLSTDHDKMSVKEWRRLKTLENGGEIKLSSLSQRDLKNLLDGHAFLDAILIDKHFLDKDNKLLLDERQIDTFVVDGTNLIKGKN